MASVSLDPADLFSVRDLVAVVTGGGTGIGLMIAQTLEANGAVVYIIGRRQETLEKAASTAKHGNIIPIKGDVTSKSNLEAAVNQIKEKSGFVNVVVANSGVTGPSIRGIPPDADLGSFRDHLWASDSSEFTNTYAVNTTAVFYTVVAFLELLDEGNKKGNLKQQSQVIATSSIGAYNRVPLSSYAYGSSKAALVHMMKQFATGLTKYDIRSNVIAPGLYPSEMTQNSLMRQSQNGKFGKDIIPAGRAGDIEDMGGAILYLVSRAGAFINGNVLITDGGRLSIVPASY